MAVKNKTHRLGIDCRLAGNQHAGIGRYSENLVRELIQLNQLDKKLIFVLFFFDLNQAKAVLGENIYQKAKKYSLEIIKAPVRHYSLKEQILMPKIYKEANLDLLHVPHFNVAFNYRGPLVITIHDLLWHQQKGKNVTTLNPIKYYFKYLAYLSTVKHAIKHASAVFVPAQTIKKTVLKYYPFAKNKIVVTPEGIADLYLKNSQRLLTQKKATKTKKVKKQLVYTGSLYPHKNLILVIKALVKLPKYQLLVVGSRNVFQARVRNMVARYKVKKQVQFLGYLEDRDLIKLYQESQALVQPSLSEGFGLTGVEAMAAGTLVLASDIPIFHEVYKNQAVYFKTNDCQSFIEALEKLEYSNREESIKKNLKFAQQYQWETMAKQNFQTYQKILSKN